MSKPVVKKILKPKERKYIIFRVFSSYQLQTDLFGCKVNLKKYFSEINLLWLSGIPQGRFLFDAVSY